VRLRVRVAAFAGPLCVLPSAAWRLSLVIHLSTGGSDPCVIGGTGELVYITALSVVSMGAALLSIGPVRPWGEVFPLWLPIVGGRPVPLRVATAVALAGATLIGLLMVYGLLNLSFGQPPPMLPPGCEQPGFWTMILYLPLIAWSPLLLLVTLDYYRRRASYSPS